MTTVSKSVRIAAPPSRVWEILAAFDRISDWAPNVDHSCLLSTETSGEGTSRRVQVGRTVLVETVVDWQDGSRLSYRIDGLPPMLDVVENTWDLTEEGNGTVVTLTANVVAGRRPPAKLAAKVAVRRIASANSEMLDGLAEALAESR